MAKLNTFPAVPIALALLFFLSGALGCGGEDDIRRVDFSLTQHVARPSFDDSDKRYVRVAVGAMISPQPTMINYQRIIAYLGRKLGRPVRIIQKKTYAEINAMLDHGLVDVAFICSGPYAKYGKGLGLKLLVVPEVGGSTFYRSYLIVRKDNPAEKISDLRGGSFAFTDPDSNTGHLTPVFWLSQLGETPEKFFSKVVYTHGHDNSIMAVAKGLVDGAAVDSLVWDFYRKAGSDFVFATKIIKSSRPFGSPPVVVSRRMPLVDSEKVRDILLNMHLDQDGSPVLKELRIDRFVAGDDTWYQPVREMHSAVGRK